jgi:hypothetical protein
MNPELEALILAFDAFYESRKPESKRLSFKRTGQYWSPEGDEALICLDTFWRNECWNELFPHATQFDPLRN